MGTKENIGTAQHHGGIEQLGEFLKGLRELAESAFPKRCPTCGRIFETAAEFVAQTQPVRAGHSGVKAVQDENGVALLEIYRNCPCGSTLMDFFGERRDVSEKGLQRRRRFGELLDYLVSLGIDKALARAELLKAMRGEPSEVLKNIAPPSPRKTA
jgi:hypothetical protein